MCNNKLITQIRFIIIDQKISQIIYVLGISKDKILKYYIIIPKKFLA